MMREILRKIFQKNDNDHIVAELRVKQHVSQAIIKSAFLCLIAGEKIFDSFSNEIAVFHVPQC